MRVLVAVIAAGIASFAKPSYSASVVEDDFLGTVPIVLSATRLTQSALESPSSLTVIDRELISASGARNIAEIMALVPGFQVGYQRGNRPVVTYHGLGDEFARRMQVLIDGRSIYVPLYGGVPWENLPLAVEDIERIEVVRGPNAAVFGPNSFSAVISITTREAYEERGLLLRANRGQNAINDGLVRFGGEAGGGSFRLTAERSADTGFEDLHDTRESELLNFRYDRPIGLRDELTIQAGLNRGRNQLGENLDARALDASSTYYQVRWERSYSPRESLSVQMYGSRYDVDDAYLLSDPPNGIDSVAVDLSATADRHELELQWTIDPSDAIRTAMGGSIRKDQVRSRGYLGRDDWIDNQVLRLFAHAEYSATRKLLLNFGAMVEDNDITGTDTSPRVALVYRLDANQSLRASRSYATRTPVILEELANQVVLVDVSPPFEPLAPSDPLPQILWRATGGLDPERIESTEIGYRMDSTDHRLSLDIKLFHDEIEDILDDIRRDDIPAQLLTGESPITHANVVDISIEGIETALDWSPTDSLRLVGSFTYMETEGNESDHVRSVPTRIGSLLGLYRLTPFHSISFDYYYQDEFEWADGQVFDVYERLDLKFQETFRWRRNQGRFALILEDVLDTHIAYERDARHQPRAFVQFSLLMP